jgi:chromatin segregation and condensation protein Rec8/ScpA/Scc1 (kleisin family)
LVREAFARAEARAKQAPPVSLQREPFTVKDKITDLQDRLQRHGRVSFRTWIEEARTRVDVIVTFMAILELYKSRAIEMHQDEMYGDILVVARPGVAASDADSSADDATSPPPMVSPSNADEA